MAVAATNTEWYAQTSSTQTMRTWSEVLSSYAEVPAEFQAAFPKQAADFPYTVLVPEDRLSFLQKRSAKLLCLYDDRIIVLEARRERVHVAAYPLPDILYLEQGRVLLHSWLTLQSQAHASTLAFNTVNLHHFEPVIGKIRQTRSGQEDVSKAKPDLSRFDALMTRHYKFMNFGRQSVRGGDAVICTAFQADRCIKTYKLFNRTLFQQYATGHLSILTAQELILIRESKRTKTSPRNLYGGVFTYIPLRQIQDIAFLAEPEHARRVMQITLADKIRLRAEFALDNPEFDTFQKEWQQRL